MVLGAFSLFDLVFSVFWFFIMFAWIALVISIYVDIFRSSDLSGAAKALWFLLVIVLPLIGVLAYLVIRGGEMQERREVAAVEREKAFGRYLKGAVGGTETSVADELAKLGRLRQDGTITEEEFQQLKTKLVS